MVNDRAQGSLPLGDDFGRDERVEEVVAEYVDRLNRGEEVSSEEVFATHPDVAATVLEELEWFVEVGAGVAAASEPLGTLGDYTLRRQIGRGGMGVVYEAWQGSMDRVVALKVLPPAVAADDRAYGRFMQEARAAGKLSHPNVVAVHASGQDEQTPYYAMEFVEGETLARVLEKTKGVEPETETRFGKKDSVVYFGKLADAFAEVADGLQHAHSTGVVHRDIKPSNLILDRDGRLRILDFGLARLEGQESLTLSGDFVGTPLYMSPEQARRKKIAVDHRTDVYSLGATMYEALCARPPFRGKDHADTLSQIIERDPLEPRKVNPRVPKDLETIVLKCLQKDAADRYGTAEALGQDLRRFVRGAPIEAQPERNFDVWCRRLRRHRRAATVAGIVGALLFACLALLLRLDRARDAEQRVLDSEIAQRIVGASLKVLRGEWTIEPSSVGIRWRDRSVLVEAFVQSSDRRYVRSSGRLALEEAVGALESAARNAPNRMEAHYWLGRARVLLGKKTEACDALTRALELEPGFTPARVLLDELAGLAAGSNDSPGGKDPEGTDEGSWGQAWRRARNAVRRKEWSDAIEAYDELIALDRAAAARGETLYLGSFLELLLSRGVAHLESDQAVGVERAKLDFAAARTVAVRDWGDFVEPTLLLGRAYVQDANIELADALFREAQANTADPYDVARWIAVLYRYMGEPSAAAAWVKADGSLSGRRLYQQVLQDLGHWNEAVHVGEAIVAQSGGELTDWMDLARSLGARHGTLVTKNHNDGTPVPDRDNDLAALARVEGHLVDLGREDWQAQYMASHLARLRGEPTRARSLFARAQELAQPGRSPPKEANAQRSDAVTMNNAAMAAASVVLAAGSLGAQNLEYSAVCGEGSFGEAELATGLALPGRVEWRPAISAGRTELFFHSVSGGQVDLMIAEAESSDGLSVGDVAIRPLSELNTADRHDAQPWISRDGRRIYFNRYNGDIYTGSGSAIYRARRSDIGAPFESVELLELPAFSSDEPHCPSLTEDERELFFMVFRGGTIGLAVAWREPGEDPSRPFTHARVLDEINTNSSDEALPGISADGLVLFWSNYQRFPQDNFGLSDLWFATRSRRFRDDGEPEPFGSKQRLPLGVNSAFGEYTPIVTWDWPARGSELWFARCEPVCNSTDLWRAPWIPETTQDCPGPVPDATFRRGDCNDDGTVDIADPVATLFSVFLGQSDPTCDDACDANDDGLVDVSDPITTLSHLFLGDPVVILPPGTKKCGVDPTDDGIGCESFSRCPAAR